jgi:3-hydroxyisobutyrate dehydrogenase-like beta-hydroxyacid dehydrogenase
MTVVGVLHPGSMGAAVAGQLVAAGAVVLWCGAERSPATRRRADAAGLTETRTLAELVTRSEVILSLCPPANAEQVADQVARLDFGGVYLEANAISPGRVARIASRLGASAAAVVDGAVIGSPPREGKSARLYLAGQGEAVQSVGDLFAGTAVEARILAGGSGKASALKLSYSSYQKASRALAAVAQGLAAAHGVEDELLDIAAQRTSNYLCEVDYIPKTAARSWRWAPEMREAADALRAAGLPMELAEAAATVMTRWRSAKDSELTVADALQHLGSSRTGHDPDQ